MELSKSQQERFLRIVEGSPKHIGQSLQRKKNEDLLAWVESHEFDFEIDSVTERVFLIMSEENPVCENGQKRSFRGWQNGYAPGCGRPKKCPCVFKLVNTAHHKRLDMLQNDEEYRDQVSKKIKKALRNYYDTASEEELAMRFESIKLSLQSDEVKEKRAKTKIEKGLQIDPADRSERDEYYYQVGRITEQSYRDHFDKINPDNLPRGVYHLDHIYSRVQGYLNGVSPEVIGSWVNLRMITELENKEKSGRCDQTIEELYEKYGNLPLTPFKVS